MKIFVTGGAGFIGSAMIHFLFKYSDVQIVNIDCLTYAGSESNLDGVRKGDRYCIERIDICNFELLKLAFELHRPDAILHFAAESHVDRSISNPSQFVQTNVIGTYNLLACAERYWQSLCDERKNAFRFVHVSTDEVYGDLGNSACSYFTEVSRYQPSSPYSATKASSDHLVRAWFRTFSLPTIVTNCSNNYGPRQFPEKLIPLTILNAINGKVIPIYGKGDQIRDWLYVDDHVRAVWDVLRFGQPGETYNIGGHNELRNLDVVEQICAVLDQSIPGPGRVSYLSQIRHVSDRPGHDRRYAIDASKIKDELGWLPQETFSTGIQKTVEWYLNNLEWCRKRVVDLETK